MNQLIDLNKIHIDGGTQPRNDISEETVSEYAEAMREGDQFPPVVVFNDGAKYWLADGFHRYHASAKLGFKNINTDVKTGTRRDAILYSVSANAKHGIRRTNADKRKAVLTLLEDEEWSGWSNAEIARQCAVDDKTVSKYRHSIIGNSEDRATRKVKRGDQEYTVNTTNIGKKENLLDNPSDFEDQEDNGYDLPDNVDADTGEVFERVRPERKGIGLQKAHEAIAVLKQIPPNDDLLQEGYDTVIQWINYNR